MNKKIKIYSIVSGLVFLISGIAKSVSVSDFANIISQYGFEHLQIFAPFIVFLEIFIGFMLVFQVWLKKTSLIGIILLIIFSIVYAYGLVFNGITDCGCFGKLDILNTSPVFTFIRNVVLIYFLIAVWRRAENKVITDKWVWGTILVVMTAVAFMSGYNFKKIRIKGNEKYIIKAVKDTALKDFVSTAKDSTYFIFAFTYSCPHCMNSVENLKQYESLGVVDKVIGLALADSIVGEKFVEIFKPNFPIQNYVKKELLRLTNSFPSAYYIKNDSIVMEFSGELPCAYVLRAIVNSETVTDL